MQLDQIGSAASSQIREVHDFTTINGRVEDATGCPREGAPLAATIGTCVAVILIHGPSASVFVEPDDISSSSVLDICQSEVGTVPVQISILYADISEANAMTYQPSLFLI
jgi:hypothetical protein